MFITDEAQRSGARDTSFAHASLTHNKLPMAVFHSQSEMGRVCPLGTVTLCDHGRPIAHLSRSFLSKV
jgi:hypothetical protein